MVYLDDLFKTGDFAGAVSDLAAAERQKYGLGPIHQLGLVVPDVEAAAEALEKKGIGPFFIATGSPIFWHEKGEARDISGKLGMAYHHGIELELLEPLQGSDFYTRSLDPDGRIVIQHLGFLVNDVDRASDQIGQKGIGLWVRGKLRAFPTSTDFAYMDAMESGLIPEFICWRMLGFRANPPAKLFSAVGRIEKWTGKRSIRL